MERQTRKQLKLEDSLCYTRCVPETFWRQRREDFGGGREHFTGEVALDLLEMRGGAA